MLPPAVADDPDARRRFLREARAIATLHHRSICFVYQIDEVDGQLFIVMEPIGRIRAVGVGITPVLRLGPPLDSVRMALGARSSEILWSILREALVVGMIATALGLGAAALTTRAMASLLYGVGPTEYVIYAGASAALLAVALMATYVPARCVTRIDPVSALKCD